ncbi:hypothetical protein Leryth_015528 [Lithospermum erythrorhizon]|nr:hypothetical protein Leryth_015528 [Lithospermum erythrorhizon]
MSVHVVGALLLISIVLQAESLSLSSNNKNYNGGLLLGIDARHDDGTVNDMNDKQVKLLMDSEDEPTRRKLINQQWKFMIKREAMLKGAIPCRMVGRYYYNCSPRPVNPYTRGCTWLSSPG